MHADRIDSANNILFAESIAWAAATATDRIESNWMILDIQQLSVRSLLAAFIQMDRIINVLKYKSFVYIVCVDVLLHFIFQFH